MIDLAGTVTYRDGTQVAVTAAQSEYASWERYALRAGYPLAPPDLDHPGASVTMIRYLGYAASHAGRPQSEWAAWEEWDAGVTDVTLEAVDGGEIPPTPPVASADWSQP